MPLTHFGLYGPGAEVELPDAISSIYPIFTVGANDDEFNDASFTGWTAVNSGSHNPTITEVNDAVSMNHPGSDASAELHAFMKTNTVSVGDTIETCWRTAGRSQNFNIAGVIFANGTTYGAGTQVVLYYSPNESLWNLNTHTNYNTLGTITAVAAQVQAPFGDMFVRLKYTAANTWSGFASADGVSWVELFTSLAYTMTPSAFGFFCTTWSGTLPQAFSFRYFKKLP